MQLQFDKEIVLFEFGRTKWKEKKNQVVQFELEERKKQLFFIGTLILM